jgi:hypothetical protein
MLIPFGILSAAASFAPTRISVAGYFPGGDNGSTGTTTVDKFAFPADTRTTLGTGLSANTIQNAGFCNSGTAGYSVGGALTQGGTITRAADKFAFPADTRSTDSTFLAVGVVGASGLSNTGVAGYFAGGFETGTFVRLTRVTKFAFPSDTRSDLATGLATARSAAAPMSNPSVAGYVGGGTGTVIFSSVEKFAFPADTRTTLGTGMSYAARTLGGMANAGVAGYIAGGRTDDAGVVRTATVNKFAFPSDTRSTLGTGLSVGRQGAAGMADSGVGGYFGGGQIAGGAMSATVDKFAFPSDTRSTLATGLSSARQDFQAFANEGTF